VYYVHLQHAEFEELCSIWERRPPLQIDEWPILSPFGNGLRYVHTSHVYTAKWNLLKE
jgi:hypothetical protein